MEPIRVLLVEDNDYDADAAGMAVRKAKVDARWTRVMDEPALRKALAEPFDVLVTDFRLPALDAFRVLDLLKESGADVPALVVTGAIDDELAAECIKRGAVDYLLKDRLARLGGAIVAAIENHKEHRRRTAAEARLLAEARSRVALYEMLSRSAYGKGLGEEADPAFVLAPLLEPGVAPRVREIRYERQGQEPIVVGEQGSARQIRKRLESPAGDFGTLVFGFDRVPDSGESQILGEASAVFLDYLSRVEYGKKLVKSLEEREELLRETHHRVKNNLAAVASLLAMEAQRAGEGEAKLALETVGGRIDSMSLVHELLYSREGFSGINFEEYCEELAARIAKGLDTETRLDIDIDCGGLHVPLETAVTLGVLVNDLVRESFRRFEAGRIAGASLRAYRGAGNGKDRWIIEYAEEPAGDDGCSDFDLGFSGPLVDSFSGEVSREGRSRRLRLSLDADNRGELVKVRRSAAQGAEIRYDFALLDKALGAAPTGILVYDAAADCVFANKEVARIAGATVQALLGQNYRKIESWKRYGLKEAAEEALSDDGIVERVFHSFSTFGREVFADYRFRSFDFRGGRYLLVLVAEVTPRLRDLAIAEPARGDGFPDAAALAALLRAELAEPLLGIEAAIKDPRTGEESDAAKALRSARSALGDISSLATMGSAGIASEPVDMEALARAACESAVAKGERPLGYDSRGLPTARGDPDLLRELWRRLVANAVKSDAANIAVEGEITARELVFRFEDDRAAFDAREAESLFATVRSSRGVAPPKVRGLDLAIAAKVVQLHRGQIWAEAPGGEGAALAFSLPIGGPRTTLD